MNGKCNEGRRQCVDGRSCRSVYSIQGNVAELDMQSSRREIPPHLVTCGEVPGLLVGQGWWKKEEGRRRPSCSRRPFKLGRTRVDRRRSRYAQTQLVLVAHGHPEMVRAKMVNPRKS